MFRRHACDACRRICNPEMVWYYRLIISLSKSIKNGSCFIRSLNASYLGILVAFSFILYVLRRYEAESLLAILRLLVKIVRVLTCSPASKESLFSPLACSSVFCAYEKLQQIMAASNIVEKIFMLVRFLQIYKIFVYVSYFSDKIQEYLISFTVLTYIIIQMMFAVPYFYTFLRCRKVVNTYNSLTI